jgi:hypothetical protein
MQTALANLRLWVALVGNDERPTIHLERVTEAIGALGAGLAEIRCGQSAADPAGDETGMALMDEAAVISQIQEQVMKRGVALPADVIAMVLDAEEHLLCDGAVVIDFVREEDHDGDDDS